MEAHDRAKERLAILEVLLAGDKSDTTAQPSRLMGMAPILDVGEISQTPPSARNAIRNALGKGHEDVAADAKGSDRS